MADLSRLDDGTLFLDNPASVKAPTLLDSFVDASEAKAAKEDVYEATSPPILAMVKQYMKFCASAFKGARRRDAASGRIDLKTLDIGALIREADALPPAVRHGAALKAVTVAGDPAADLAPFGGQAEATYTAVGAEWRRLLGVYENTASIFYMGARRANDMYKYWVKVREGCPNVAAIMLFWLAHPVGTAGLERDFSGLTMITRDYRRSRLKGEHFCDAVYSHCFKAELSELLDADTKM